MSPLSTKASHVPRRWRSLVAGGFFTLFLVCGAVSLAYAWLGDKLLFDIGPVTVPTVMDGEVTRRFGEGLSQAALPKLMASLERGGSWLFLGNLGPRVRQGCRNWLFLADEMLVYATGVTNARHRLDTVSFIRNQLADRNISLVVVVVPDKSRIQKDQLCGLYRPASLDGRLGSWINGLKSRGVTVVSLESALTALAANEKGPAPFLRTDTHWSQTGALAAAKVVARNIISLGVDISPVQPFSISYGTPERRPGDLVRLAGISWLPVSLQPTPEWVAPLQLRSVELPSDTTPEPIQSSDDKGADLFGDEGLPTLSLLGTSYSRTSQFVPYLESELETRITNMARDGGDFWRAASHYFASASFHDTPPKLIIWEIPERVIQMPISQEERLWTATPLSKK